jgi:hypothetical protein
MTTSATDIAVTGDHATAELTSTHAKTPALAARERTTDFVREGGEWKICGGK